MFKYVVCTNPVSSMVKNGGLYYILTRAEANYFGLCNTQHYFEDGCEDFVSCFLNSKDRAFISYTPNNWITEESEFDSDWMGEDWEDFWSTLKEECYKEEVTLKDYIFFKAIGNKVNTPEPIHRFSECEINYMKWERLFPTSKVSRREIWDLKRRGGFRTKGGRKYYRLTADEEVKSCDQP